MTNVEIVKRFSSAFSAKDSQAVQEVVATDYVFKGPMAELKSREELIDFMNNMPMKFEEKNHTYIEQGDKVAKAFVVDFSEPPIGSVDMCEIFTVENGKIKSTKMFYDTALFPKPAEEAACK